MGTRRPHRRRYPRRLEARAAAWAVALLAAPALGAGCGAPRVDTPVPAVPPDAPAVATAPDDPADDPQLDALDLPEAAAGVGEGVGAGAPPRDDVARLERLPALVEAVEAELGPGVEACAVDAGYTLAVRVPTDTSLAEWRLRDDGTLLQAQAQASQACDTTFPLDEPDYAAPARLAAGALARQPGAAVSGATFGVDSEWGLVWRVDVLRGGASAAVVADPAGKVLAVTL